MKPEEAIKLNNELLRTGNYDCDPKYTKAIKLGIEALKRIKRNRRDNYMSNDQLLPSETEE